MDQAGEYKACGVSLKSSNQRLKTEERNSSSCATHKPVTWHGSDRFLLGDGDDISLARHSWYMSMSIGVQTSVSWWKWNLSAKTFMICPWVWECKPVLVDGSGISSCKTFMICPWVWEWRSVLVDRSGISPQDIHDMSMSIGVQISVGQLWLKLQSPVRFRLYNLTDVVRTSSCGQRMQLGWRLLAGYYIFEHLWSSSLPVHEQIITCSLIWFEHDQ
jgi:hypothetical protein